MLSDLSEVSRIDAVEVSRGANADDPLKECVVELLIQKEALADQTQDLQVFDDVPHKRISVNILIAIWNATYPTEATLATASTNFVKDSSWQSRRGMVLLCIAS